MSWYLLSSAFLAGLAAWVVPVILHWLQRKPKNPVNFPSFDFLFAAQRKHRRSNNWRKWLVLLLRLAAIALAALAFCRPYRSGHAPEPEEARVLLWDDSASVGANGTGVELENRLLYELKKVSPQRPAVIGLVREKGRVLWSGDFSGDREGLTRWWQEQRHNQGASHFAGLPVRVDFRLKNQNAPRREVVLFTDNQSLPWSGLELGATLAEADSVRVESVPLPENAFSLQTPRILPIPPAEPGGKGVLELECDVVNHSARSVEQLRLRAGSIAGAYAECMISDLAPRESRRVKLRLEAGEDAASAGWLQLAETDEFPLDNTLYFACDPEVQTKIAVGAPEAGNFDFTALALGVEPGNGGDELTELEAVGRMVFQQSPDHLTVERQRQLGGFVAAGGTLVLNLAAGSPELSALVEKWGVELPPRRSAVEGTFHFGSFDFSHPALTGMREWSLNGWFDVLFFRTCQAELPPGARILAAFDDGRPAVAELSAGRGKVVLVFTTFATEAGSWPTHYSFLPFWREVAKYYTRQSRPAELFFVGDAVPMAAAEAVLEQRADDGAWQVVKENRLALAGIYRRGTTAGATRFYAVNQPETELRFVTREALPELTAATARKHVAIPVQSAPVTGNKEWFRLLLVLALACWLGELLLANRTAL